MSTAPVGSLSFAIAESNEAAASLNASMTLIGSADVPIRAAKATLEIGALPPGRYTASAVLHIAGKPVGKVSRAVEIVR